MGGPGAAMTVRGLLIVCAVAPVVAAAVSAQTPQTLTGAATTVRDRVYSQEQAGRGKTTYDTKCASCHDGGTMGPELWGDPFLAEWDNKSVGAFFSRIKTTMPEDAAGSLSENEVLDVIAYVVQTNGFPAGEKGMRSESALATIKFVRNK